MPQSLDPHKRSWLVHAFIVTPLLITVSCLVVYGTIRLFTHDSRTVYDYLQEMRTGDISRRWQAAFEVAKIITATPGIAQEPRFVSEMTTIFQESRTIPHAPIRQKLRSYLAIAMGKSGNDSFVEPLLQAIALPNPQESDVDVVYTIIYALGILQDQRGLAAVEQYLTHQSPSLRIAAVGALGSIGTAANLQEACLISLQKMLQDGEPNVQWEAAISLAKLGNTGGQEVLLKLLDRKYLAQFSEISLEEQTRMMMVTITAAKGLQMPLLSSAIEKLSQEDPNMGVRKVAQEFLQSKRK